MKKLIGDFDFCDGTIDFYLRVHSLLNKEIVVLDLGAGRASWYEDDYCLIRKELRCLKGKVKKIIASDVDKIVLENKSVDFCLYHRPYEEIPVEDHSIDIVICDYVFEHIQDVDFFLKSLNRIIKKNGWVCARTPHKYNYIAFVSSLIPNYLHSKVVKIFQPGRLEVDVFPAYYKLNTLSALRKHFTGYENNTFLFRSSPAYYFGNKILLYFLQGMHRLIPKVFVSNLFVFLQKK